MIAPVFFMQPIIGSCCVRTAMRKSEKIYYRIIKTNIKTDTQNYLMFSTDDQNKDWSEEDEQNEKVNNKVSKYTNKKSVKNKKEEESSEDEHDTKEKLYRLIEAPTYNVDIKKVYKPIYMVFIDFVIFMTYMNVTIIFYWSK